MHESSFNFAMATISSTSASSPSVTVTADGLVRALDKMGLTESVSAALLYDTILQLQSPPQPQTTPGPSDAIPQTAKEGSRLMLRTHPEPISPATASAEATPLPDFFDPVRVEDRRKIREMTKAAFPNGVPSAQAGYGYM